MRTCACTGYLTNPEGKCCMDVGRSSFVPYPNTYVGGAPFPPSRPALTEDDVRRIIREEFAAALKKKGK